MSVPTIQPNASYTSFFTQEIEEGDRTLVAQTARVENARAAYFRTRQIPQESDQPITFAAAPLRLPDLSQELQDKFQAYESELNKLEATCNAAKKQRLGLKITAIIVGVVASVVLFLNTFAAIPFGLVSLLFWIIGALRERAYHNAQKKGAEIENQKITEWQQLETDHQRNFFIERIRHLSPIEVSRRANQLNSLGVGEIDLNPSTMARAELSDFDIFNRNPDQIREVQAQINTQIAEAHRE